MSGIGQCFPERHREQFSFGGNSTVLRRRPYFLLGIDNHRSRRFYNVAPKSTYFLLNQGISVTLRGTFKVLPLRPSSDLTDLAFDRLGFLHGLFSDLLASCGALEAAFLVEDAAFLAVSFALVALLAVDFAFAAVFLAADLALFLATAAANLAALALFNPAFSSQATGLGNLCCCIQSSRLSFFAVAAPTPGSSVKSSPLEPAFFAMVSLMDHTIEHS